MSRGIDHVDGVVVAVGVEVLRPGVEGGAGVGIQRQEPGSGRVVVPGVHVEQARGIRYAPRERHLVEERIAAGRRHAIPPGGGQMRPPPGHVVFSQFVMQLSRYRQSETTCCPRLLDLSVGVVHIRADQLLVCREPFLISLMAYTVRRIQATLRHRKANWPLAKSRHTPVPTGGKSGLA